jgi:mono/diheme cytochrome c family protein
MAKLVMGVFAAAILVLFTVGNAQKGFQDALKVTLDWRYPAMRDMRRSVAILPQKGMTRGPDSLTVPTTGWGDALDEKSLMGQRDALTRDLRNPIAPGDTAALRQGEILYGRFCTPCHGKSLAGDGPVAAQFMPPPDLQSELVRGRSDGYIYSYIRHGGVVMPRYGQMVTAHEAWQLVHYVRHKQRTQPR